MTNEDTNPEFTPEQVPLPQLYSLLHRHVAADEVPYDLAGGLQRFTEWMADDADTDPAAQDALPAARPNWADVRVRVNHSSIQSHHRAMLAVDIDESTTRTTWERALMRRTFHGLVERALLLSGIAEHHRDPFIDRGDGLLVLIHPIVDQAPKTVLLTSVIPTLSKLLDEHAARTRTRPDRRFRLRVAIHAGKVHYDARGCYGEDVDITIRLLDSSALKQTLQRTTAPLALVVSQDVYRSAVRHRYEGIDSSTFTPTVKINIGGRRIRGWVNVSEFWDFPTGRDFSTGQNLTA